MRRRNPGSGAPNCRLIIWRRIERAVHTSPRSASCPGKSKYRPPPLTGEKKKKEKKEKNINKWGRIIMECLRCRKIGNACEAPRVCLEAVGFSYVWLPNPGLIYGRKHAAEAPPAPLFFFVVFFLPLLRSLPPSSSSIWQTIVGNSLSMSNHWALVKCKLQMF